MHKILYRGKEYEVLHKTTLLQQSMYFSEEHIKNEFLVARDGELYFADIVREQVTFLTKVSSKASTYPKQRMVRDAKTDEYIRSFELGRSRYRKLLLLLSDD